MNEFEAKQSTSDDGRVLAFQWRSIADLHAVKYGKHLTGLADAHAVKV